MSPSEPEKGYPQIPSIALFRSTMTPLARALWKPRLIGREFFPRKGPCFIYGNHSNRWDPFIINCFSSWAAPTAGVMTREYLRHPVLRRLFRGVGIIPASKRLAEPFLVRQVLELLRDNRSVVIFPEGGSRWDGTPLGWMPATAKLFVRSGVPIHPVRIHGSYAAFPRWADYPRPSHVAIEALPPITFDRRDDAAEAMARLRAYTDFDENETPQKFRPRRAYKPASGIHRILYRDPWQDSGPLASADGYVVSAPSGKSLTMLPDSTLRDEQDGTTYTVAELYKRILAMPQVNKLEERAVVNLERVFPDLEPLGWHTATLAKDHLTLESDQQNRIIALDDIIYCDIERNFKLQLYLRESDFSMIELSFPQGGSAIQWRDTLLQLRPSISGRLEPGTIQEYPKF